MLNENIKALRKAKGLSQEELAIDSVSAVIVFVTDVFNLVGDVRLTVAMVIFLSAQAHPSQTYHNTGKRNFRKFLA